MQRFLDNDLNPLLEFVPDEVCEACQIEKERRPMVEMQDALLQFRDVLELSGGVGFRFDSYATRMVVNEAPMDIQVGLDRVMMIYWLLLFRHVALLGACEGLG